jgi:AcrR family transcriptional regulator
MPAPTGPAYTRLGVDERRRQLLDAGAALFAEHAYEEISMRDIARAAGVSKPLLYHYFPSKIDLFKAAVADKATELQSVIEPASDGTPLEQLSSSLDGYLAWIEANARAWSKLVQSAASLPEARELVEDFRQRTMDMALARLTDDAPPRPALRTTISGSATWTPRSSTGPGTATFHARTCATC